MSQEIRRRIAERQLGFREQNERIYAAADSKPIVGPIPFVCECANLLCTKIVRMSDDEYDTISQHPRRFFNISGHETSSVAAGAEQVVAVVGELTLVDKVGVAGDVATQARERASSTNRVGRANSLACWEGAELQHVWGYALRY